MDFLWAFPRGYHFFVAQNWHCCWEKSAIRVRQKLPIAGPDLADIFSAKIGPSPVLLEEQKVRLKSEGQKPRWNPTFGGAPVGFSVGVVSLLFSHFFTLFRFLGDENPEILSRYSPIRPGAQESLKIVENR